MPKDHAHHLSRLAKRWQQAELLEDLRKAPKIIKKAAKHAKRLGLETAEGLKNKINKSVKFFNSKSAAERNFRNTLITQIDLCQDQSPESVADTAIAIMLKYLYGQFKSGNKDVSKIYAKLRDYESEIAAGGDRN